MTDQGQALLLSCQIPNDGRSSWTDSRQLLAIWTKRQPVDEIIFWQSKQLLTGLCVPNFDSIFIIFTDGGKLCPRRVKDGLHYRRCMAWDGEQSLSGACVPNENCIELAGCCQTLAIRAKGSRNISGVTDGKR